MTSEIYLKVAKVLVGNHPLHEVWGGLVASAILSVIVLKAYYGWVFMKLVKIQDIFLWLIGIFITMRLSMVFVSQIHISFLKEVEELDSVLVGASAGVINTWLFVKNYQPLVTILDNKIFGKFKSRKIEDFKKLALGKCEVSEVVKELSADTSNSIVMLIELSNGGGVPKVDTPLYYNIINCNNDQILNVWGDGKKLCPDAAYKHILELVSTGIVNFDPSSSFQGDYKAFIKANGLNIASCRLVGTVGNKKLMFLACVNAGGEGFEYDSIRLKSSAKKIKRIINKNKKLWETKIT